LDALTLKKLLVNLCCTFSSHKENILTSKPSPLYTSPHILCTQNDHNIITFPNKNDTILIVSVDILSALSLPFSLARFMASSTTVLLLHNRLSVGRKNPTFLSHSTNFSANFSKQVCI
jgi:hypothetical protein